MAAQRVQRPSASTDADASPGCATGFSAWMNNIGRGVQDGLSRVTESMDRAADDFIRSLDPGPYPGGTYGGDPVATGVPVSMSGGGSHSGVPMATGVPVSLAAADLALMCATRCKCAPRPQAIDIYRPQALPSTSACGVSAWQRLRRAPQKYPNTNTTQKVSLCSLNCKLMHA